MSASTCLNMTMCSICSENAYTSSAIGFYERGSERRCVDMLRHELRERIPNAFGDQEGPWKLLAYLDEIQPPIDTEILVCPSYSIKPLFEDIKRDLGEAPVNVEQLRQALLRLTRKALKRKGSISSRRLRYYSKRPRKR